jgi:hypothetical protein
VPAPCLGPLAISICQHTLDAGDGTPQQKAIPDALHEKVHQFLFVTHRLEHLALVVKALLLEVAQGALKPIEHRLAVVDEPGAIGKASQRRRGSLLQLCGVSASLASFSGGALLRI